MTGYIGFLRNYVGHQPIQMCGAGVFVENEQGELLLGLRTDNHCWGIAGGAVELGETVEAAAMREMFEETGLIADELELLGVFSGEDTHYTYPALRSILSMLSLCAENITERLNPRITRSANCGSSLLISCRKISRRQKRNLLRNTSSCEKLNQGAKIC